MVSLCHKKVPGPPGGTQTTFRGSCDLARFVVNMTLVTKLEGLYIFYMDFVGFCTWHSTTFLDAIGNFVTAAARKAPSDSGAPFPPVAELEQMPLVT